MHKISWLRHEVRSLFNYLLPPACALCLEPLLPAEPDSLCQNCTTQIIPLKRSSCPRCALPYPSKYDGDHFCQTCLLEKKPLFTGVTSVGYYDGLLRDAIHRFKYRNNINLDRPLAAMLTDLLNQKDICCDMVIPVPLHRNKLRQRTYNQSALIARKLAHRMNLPVKLNLLKRIKQAPPQQSLSARDRLQNVRGAFTLDKKLHDQSILLVDDVMTTGATARECARTLLKGGAGSIQIAILARAALR